MDTTSVIARLATDESISVNEIASLVGTNYQTVYQVIRKHNLRPVGTKKDRTGRAIKACCEQGLTIAETAVKLNITVDTVYAYKRNLQLQFASPDNQIATQVSKLASDGFTTKEIAAALNIAEGSVTRYARNLGIKITHPRTKELMTRDEQICAMFRSGGQTLQSVANEFGITRERVRQILVKYGIDERHQFTFANSGRLDEALKLYELGEDMRTIAKSCGIGYQSWIGYSKPLEITKRRRVNRFWRMVAVTADPNKCWNWSGCPGVSGYSRTSWNGRGKGCHQIAYFLHHGKWASRWTLHKCDNPTCCNPKHLYDGTPQDNVRDRDSRGRTGKIKKRLKWDDVKKIRRLLKNGLTQHAIAAEFGVGVATINNINCGKIWKSPHRIGNRVLRTRQVLNIRRSLAGGSTHTALAKAFSVSPQTISRIANDRSYTDKIFYP